MAMPPGQMLCLVDPSKIRSSRRRQAIGARRSGAASTRTRTISGDADFTLVGHAEVSSRPVLCLVFVLIFSCEILLKDA